MGAIEVRGLVREFKKGPRAVDGIEKKPATRELIHGIRALSTDPEIGPELLADDRRLPFLGVLFKKSEDLERARRALRQTGR